jgi:steroid 5-alpha reductase family enzyme
MTARVDKWRPSWDASEHDHTIGEALKDRDFAEAGEIASDAIRHRLSDAKDFVRDKVLGKPEPETLADKARDRLDDVRDRLVDAKDYVRDKILGKPAPESITDKARDMLDRRADQAAHLAQEAKEGAKQGANRLREGAIHARDRAAHIAREGLDSAKHSAEAARDKAGHLAEDAISSAREAAHNARLQAQAAVDKAGGLLSVPLAWADANLLHQSLTTQLFRCFALATTIQFVFGLLPHLLFGASRQRPMLNGITIAVTAAFSFLTSPNWSLRQALLLGAVLLWATRLSLYITLRSRSHAIHLKNRPGAKAVSWGYNTLHLCLCLLPVILANADAPSVHEAPANYYTIHSRWGDVKLPIASWLPNFMRPAAAAILPAADPIGAVEIVGFSMFILGFLIEAVADYQKAKHHAGGAAPNMPVTSGLYSRIRYPGYLGEIMLWTGICIASIRGQSGLRWLSLLAPIMAAFTTILVTGIPVQEEAHQKKYGENAEYKGWLQKTKLILPYLF